MKPFLTLLCLLMCASSFAQEPEKTKADTNREVVRTYARIYLETREYAKAEDMVSQYLTLDAGDANLWIILGQTQMRERKISQACYSFQKASTLFKDQESQVFANYYFADCLNQGARPSEAKIILARMIPLQGDYTTAPEDALYGMKNGTIRSGQAFPPYQKKGRSRFRVSAGLASGFDTNVLLIEEDVMNNTPVSDRGSFFVTPAIQVGYQGNAFGDSFDSRYIASYTDYFNAATSAYDSLYQRADFSFGSGPVRWGAFGDILFLNRTPFQLYDWEAGISYLNIRKATADYVFTWEVPLKFQKYTLDSNSGDDNDRTGEDVQFKATARWIQGPTQLFNLQGILDGQYTKGKNYRLVGLDIPALYITELPLFSGLGLANTFSAEAQVQYYLSSDLDRRDLLLKAGTGLLKSLGNELNVSLDVAYQKNLSSVVSARYNKMVISLQLSHDFL